MKAKKGIDRYSADRTCIPRRNQLELSTLLITEESVRAHEQLKEANRNRLEYAQKRKYAYQCCDV